MKITELSYPGLKKLTGIDIFWVLGSNYLELLHSQVGETLPVEKCRDIVVFWIQHRN